MLSPEQQLCVQAAESGSSSILVKSCAGSGKTTTGVAMLRASSGRRQACAFNVRNKEDLEAKLEGLIPVGTFNGFGHRAWGKRIRKFCKVNKLKTWQLADKVASGINSEAFPDLTRCVGLAKAYGFVPEGAPGGMKGLEPDTPELYQQLIEEKDLDTGEYKLDTAADIVRQILLASIREAWQGNIDFDDQIYMSAIYEGDFDGVDVLGVDEVQDTSAIQLLMFKRMNPKRIFALGDQHQAIYAFRGADHLSIANFLRTFSSQEMNLTHSFRCPKAVVEEARKWVSHINATPEAPDGSVSEIDSWGPRTLTAGDVIVCRNSRPLFPIAMSCLRSGVGVRVLGTEIGEGLVRLIKKECKGLRTMQEAENTITSWMRSTMEKAKSDVKRQYAEDKGSSIITIAQAMGDSASVSDLVQKIEQMFSPDRKPITLSTVHKAKGLEWKRVFFLDRDLIPSRWARTEADLQQESNIAYVAVTRAQRDLVYCSSKAFSK